MRVLLAIFVVAVALIVYLYEDSAHSTYPPGILAPEEPSQLNLSGGVPWRQGKFLYTPRAEFSMRARVLSTKRYWFDGASAVSPVDFAVGWGPMSDQAVIDQIGCAQTQRSCRYWPKGRQFPLSAGEIASHSANMHMIPADKEIGKALRDVRRGDLISLGGYLVSVSGENGWKWDTSLSRTDSGNGACEIVWVKRLENHRRRR
ncbi:MAG: hypothetical protein IT159_07495 [Bryobacterales bacterium]|nr:hypothetical protein [Bryobacterales bacterium]